MTMGFITELKRFFSEMIEVSKMAHADAATRQIPDDAQYVSVGPILVLGDVDSFLHRTKGFQKLGFLPEMMHFAAPGYGQQIYYLVINSNSLMLVREGAVQYTTPISAIAEAQAYLRGGFVISLANGQGLAVATQTPVTIPPGATYSTVSGVTNIFSGWDKELTARGVNCKF